MKLHKINLGFINSEVKKYAILGLVLIEKLIKLFKAS